MVNPRLLSCFCYLAMVCLAIALNLLPVFLTTLGLELGGLGKEALGRLGAIGFCGLVAGILITGPLADRFGAKPFALLGSGLMAIALPAAAFASSYDSVAGALFVLGLGAGILDMLLSPIIAALNVENRARALNWLHSFYCVGAAVTILLSTLVLASGHGWRLACLLLIPLPVAVGVGLAFLTFPPLPAGEGGQRVRDLVRHPWFLGALLAIFLGGALEGGMMQWLPAYAETTLHFPVWFAGAALLLFSLAMAAGRMVIGLMPRVNPFTIMAWSCGLSIVCVFLGAFLPQPGLALANCILVGFTGSCLWPMTLAVTADRFPAGNASMFALLAALGNAGGILLPWAVGWLADRSDLRIGLAISAIAPVLLLPLVIVLGRARRAF